MTSMEDLERDTPEALAWQREQDAETVAALRAWPHRDELRGALEPLVASRHVVAPVPAGGRWFQISAGLGLTVADTPDGPPTVLLHPVRASLDWFFPSRDGRLVAVGLSEGGSEQSVLRIVETAGGRLLPDEIEHASLCRVTWLPDGSGFYYCAGTAPDSENAQKHIWFHRVGHPPPAAPEPVGSRTHQCFPQVSADGRYVTCHPSVVEPRPDHVLDRRSGTWRPFLRDADGVFVGCFEGDRFIAATTDGAPRGRVVSIPVDAGADRSRWVELVAEGEAVIRQVAVVAGRLIVVSLVDASCRVAVHALDGRFECFVPEPSGIAGIERGAWLQEPMLATDGTQLSFVVSTPTSSSVRCVYDVPRRRLRRLGAPAVTLPGAVVRRIEARAPDGAAVRAWLVHDAAHEPGEPRPTLIHAYGGWNAAFMPVWPGAAAAIVRAGGVLALANLRGGGEFGADQWRHGRREHKQRSFDDLFALAEHLIAERIAAEDRLALMGASNGGLLAAAAVTQRPDLWRAVASLVPVTDMLGFARDPNVAQGIEENGDPEDPAFRSIIASYSPCERVRPGVRYPATLVACAGDDLRCPPWHSRKFVAALQQATAGDAPILLRVWPGASHMSHASDLDQTTDWLGFVMAELGLAP
jgi:prolyl oligopeptidase